MEWEGLTEWTGKYWEGSPDGGQVGKITEGVKDIYRGFPVL